MTRFFSGFLILLLAGAVSADEPGGYVVVDPSNSYPSNDDLQDSPATRVPGTPVYQADDCIGAVVNGVCHGSVISTDPMPERCYGQMLNGQCTGPQF